MQFTLREPNRRGARGALPLFCAGSLASLLAATACSSDRTTTERTTGNPAAAPTHDASLAAGGGAGPISEAQGGAGAPNSGGTASAGSAGAGSANGGAPNGGAGGGGGIGPRPSSGGAAAGATGSDAGVVTPIPVEPKIPPLPATCPELKTGDVKVMDQSVTLWVGEKQPGTKGPLLFYWHGTASTPDEPTKMIASVVDDVVSAGGIVASFSTTLQTGRNTSTGAWYTGDFEMADALVACATAALAIDTRRIYAAGCSAGGFQAATMAFLRSSYLAGAMANSGGVIAFPELTVLQDPQHVPSLITAHEKYGTELIDITMVSQAACKAIKDSGGFAVDCTHSAGHCGAGDALSVAQWQFLKAHPFGTKTDPYGGHLPPGFPAECTAF